MSVLPLEAHGHRGARGLRPENTLAGFAYALELGVHAVELDVGRTADGVVIVTHDPVVSIVKNRDTWPAWPDDPLFPYVGRAIRDLTLEQVKTLDAGVRRPDFADPFFLTQLPFPGTEIPTLAEVCDLLDHRDAADLCLAAELKTDPSWADDEVESFVAAVVEVLESYDRLTQSRLLGFDWRVLRAARRLAPTVERVALVDARSLEPRSPWLAGLDLATFQSELPEETGGDIVTVAAAAGATMVSPEHELLTDTMIASAHALALPVIAWTVNHAEEMRRLVERGVDAIVTDYPDRLRAVMESYDLPLPRRYPARDLVRT